MKITTLIENTKQDDNLVNEHGLSLFIETDDKKILLDTGASDNFIHNAEKLGVNIKDIDYIIISHGHYDHASGIKGILGINKKASVYMHVNATGEHYGNIGAKLTGIMSSLAYPLVKKSPLFSKYIGIDISVVSRYEKRIKFITDFRKIDDNIFAITDIPKKYPIPEGNKFLLVKKGRMLFFDDFSHEIVLVVKENNGLVVFSGCCHNGILNIIDAVRKNFISEPIKAVIGGFHLEMRSGKNDIAGTKEDIELVARGLAEKNIAEIHTGHCTGEKAFEILRSTIGDNVHRLYTGCKIEI